MSKPTYGEMRTRAERVYDAEVKESVLAGLAVLQAAWGDGWVERINCATLDLASESRCVLGQLYGDYESGCAALAEEDLDDDWGTYYGFNTYGNMEELDDAWHAVLCDKEETPGGAS